ncbi:MAG TPA: methyltransferase domain-containing protein [Candidatus Polarisedimenticolia bacterium]|nr:methyltransferase domain-containing protein [Candidatus Polarisedimenticolia bacterium]
MSEPPDAMRRYYAARAAEYDRIYDRPERRADLERLRGLLPTLLAGAPRLLDLACGTGWWTRWLAPAAGEVVALDASRETLALASARQIRTLEDGSVHRVLKNFPTEAHLREAASGLAGRAVHTALDHYWLFRYSALPEAAG